jgi:fatty-acyl-CoA synthase
VPDEVTHFDAETAVETGQGRRKGLGFAPVAFVISLFAPLTYGVAMLATRSGYISYDLGFNTIALTYVPKIATVAMILSGLSLLISVFKAPKTYGPWALAAVIVSGSVLAGYYAYELRLKANPPIHEVATDWERPVTFSSKLITARGPSAHPVEDSPYVGRNVAYEWAGQSLAAINAQTCPMASSIPGRPKDAAAVVRILRKEGYVVFGQSDWRVEAIWEDPWWGNRSDLVVRLDPDKTDIRSVSREEAVDLGGNCKRVTALITRLKS